MSAAKRAVRLSAKAISSNDDTVDALPEPNRDDALALVLQLMAIPGGSGQEGAVAEFIKHALEKAGLPASAMRHDTAHRRSILGGDIGNLIVKIPGKLSGASLGICALVPVARISLL